MEQVNISVSDSQKNKFIEMNTKLNAITQNHDSTDNTDASEWNIPQNVNWLPYYGCTIS